MLFKYLHTKKGITAYDKQQRHILRGISANNLIIRYLQGGGKDYEQWLLCRCKGYNAIAVCLKKGIHYLKITLFSGTKIIKFRRQT